MHRIVNTYPGGSLFFYILSIMAKPKEYLIFRPVEGSWLSADGVLLADYLANRGLTIDDRTEFARIKDYDEYECIWYRAYGAQKVTIAVWDLPRI